jgi:hypothetical protein
MMLSVSDINRFLAKVDKADECWLWTARKNYKGYGMFRLGSRVPYAHRVAYEHYVGPIPEGLQLDHICRVRHCVNPDHLEPVTNAENALRGEGPTAKNVTKTHCPKGHEYTGDNLYVDPRGGRNCRACRREKAKAWRAKQH